MEYTLENIINLIEEIGFEKDSTYDLNDNLLKLKYNEGYIGAYIYDIHIIQLYETKISLYFFNDTKGSFNRLSFSESISKIKNVFSKELRKSKIEKFLKNNL